MSRQTVTTDINANLIERLFQGSRNLIADPSMVLIDELPDDLFEIMSLYMPVEEVESIGAVLLENKTIMFIIDNFDFEVSWNLELLDADSLTA